MARRDSHGRQHRRRARDPRRERRRGVGRAGRHWSCLADRRGQRVYVFARKGEQEVAQALDLETGKTLWTAGYDQPYTMNSAATRTARAEVDAGARRGAPLHAWHHRRAERLRRGDRQGAWRHAFDKEFGPPPDFGTASRPSFDNGLLIAHVGGISGGALRAFDPRPAPRSGAGRRRPGYASPVPFTAGGVRQMSTRPSRRSSASTRRPARCCGRCRSTRRTSRTRVRRPLPAIW